ncbi:hypothetical protein JI59_12265 [Novosphingobium pentaromativorans US6-1]|nr:hypothetical protein JI59_12265 [Novosphingobium pentaromativorans US6-1]
MHQDIERFLYREARTLDQERFREWIDTMIDPAIHYQMVVRDERYLKDKTPEDQREVFVYDDELDALEMRVRQFETGLQWMMDPPQKLIRFVSNVEAFHDPVGELIEVLSCGKAYRYRRGYEQSEVVYRRTDRVRQLGDGAFRIVSRRIDLLERVVSSKNLLFFL